VLQLLANTLTHADSKAFECGMKKGTESFAETSNNCHRTWHHMPDGLWLVRWCGCSHTTEPTTTIYFNRLF